MTALHTGLFDVDPGAPARPAGAPRVIGIDPSLRSTGLAVITGTDTVALDTIPTTKPRHTSTGHGDIARDVDTITRRLLDYTTGVDLAVIEGPSLGSTGRALFQLAAVWWGIYGLLARLEIPTAVMTPAGRMAYATGKGARVDKADIREAIVRRYPAVRVGNSDEADAFVLAAAGRDWLGHPLAAVPQTHRKALGGVAWPG